MGTAFPFLKEKNHVVSIIGGGGKTTLLYEMAGFCVKNDQKVLVTTSTHIYRPPKEWHDQSLEAVERKLRTGRAAIIGSACRDPEKLSMPETELFEEARKKADLTLIEADGARHLPCKAPAEHEPALLSSSDLVIGVTAAWQGLLSGRTGGGTAWLYDGTPYHGRRSGTADRIGTGTAEGFERQNVLCGTAPV